LEVFGREKGGEGILLRKCVWFIFLRRKEEGKGGKGSKYKHVI
jgi:hypothetical protein